MPSVTPCRDVDEIITFFTAEVTPILAANLVGVYLTGSLSYDAFRYGSSDIDITVIVRQPVSAEQLAAIAQLHRVIEAKFSAWAARLECSYTPLELLPSVLPPGKPRPWYWGHDRVLYAEAPYGNEWIINNYLLYNHAIPLVGPAFSELTGPVDVREVQKACVRDLFTEWEPKEHRRSWFAGPLYECYFVINLCRILYTVNCGAVGSKQAAAAWVRDRYAGPWGELVESAERWHYGVELDLQDEAIRFLHFVIQQVTSTELCKGMRDEVAALRASHASA